MIFTKRNNGFYINYFDYFGRFSDNFSGFKLYLSSRSIDEKSIDTIINIFKSHIKKDDIIRTDILNLSETTKRILEVNEQTKLKNIKLTTIGKVIAITNYDQVNGEKLDMDVFID